MKTIEKQSAQKQESNYSILDQIEVFSDYLDRDIKIDVYLPKNVKNSTELSLLIVNDGQDLKRMPFIDIMDKLYAEDALKPLVVVALHCSAERRLEYATADVLDYANRGSRARYYRKFILKELIPGVKRKYNLEHVVQMGFAGFSLGGLSAIDIAWCHPELFNKVGVFSGSFWWRKKDLNQGYVESEDRIMHNLIRAGKHQPNMKFFFETGTQDETADRNNNGIIDSIDDTLGIITELEAHGYKNGTDIKYLELPDGKHDVPTWARAFPTFLKWGWGK